MRGVGAPRVFYNRKTQVRVVVHGNDFAFAGVRRELVNVYGKMVELYDVKLRGIMGGGADEVRKIKILGRTMRWLAEGIENEADGTCVVWMKIRRRCGTSTMNPIMRGWAL